MKKATRYNTVSLNKLSSAVEGDNDLDISNNNTMKASQITIIKRSGEKEPFMPDKLKRVCLWATKDIEALADELIRDTEIKLHKEIRIQDMYQQLIVTAVNKISMLYPIWEEIAGRLELVKIYKETAGISHLGEYTHLSEVFQKGIQHKIYYRKTFDSFTPEEIDALNSAIKPERDLLFNYKGISIFNDKYCLNYTKTKKLELPQHTYMRVAMALNAKETDRISRTIETYNALSEHGYTAATPIMMNAFTPGQQLSSCVLNTLDDDSHSILDTGKNLGIYSKFKGGTALDISPLRAKGSYIEGAQGYSSGPVPFMKFYESIMKAWNQGGKRCVSPDSEVNKLVNIKFDKDYPVVNGYVTIDDLTLSVTDLCKFVETGLEFEYSSTNVMDISEGDYIESYNILLKESEPQRVNEIIHSEIPVSDQLNIIHTWGSLTVSLDTKIFTDTGYKKARELGLKDRVLVNGCFEYIHEIKSGYKPQNFIDYNISENSNFYVKTKGEKILIHNSGSLAVYFDWWHLDVFDILSLKSNGGTEENRARGLQYGIKMHQYFLDAVIRDEEIQLFDPRDTQDLVGKTGEEFKTLYEKHKSRSIKKKTIKARDLWYDIMKQRSETGNIYLFHYENVNEASLLNRYIGSSNLCTEIALPSRASKPISEEIVYYPSSDTSRIVKEYTAGEIALCNLSSFNLEKMFYMDYEERKQLVKTVVRSLDNTVDLAVYPVKEGEHSNKMYRYLGLGVLNYTNYLALKKIVIDTQEAHEETARLFDELSYMIIEASCELAIEKGRFSKFYETEWAKGILPVHKANKKALALTEFQPDMKKWDSLAEKVKTFGLRNAQLMAVAPTATSGRAINATESTEPIHDFYYKEEGTLTIPTLAPNFRKNNQFYKKAFECDQFALMRNAVIRQIYIDQAQSVNTYISRPDSFKDMTLLHLYYFDLGGKTLYYLKQQKETEEEICESCT